MKNLDGQVCEICGDSVGLTVDGDLFVACEECGFPVCRPCYEYERREGTQVCPQCHTRYKRIKGMTGVPHVSESVLCLMSVFVFVYVFHSMRYIYFSIHVSLYLIVISCNAKGSPRVVGDEDEEDVDDIEQEFKMEEEKYKLMHEEDMDSRDDDDENTKYRELPGGAKLDQNEKTDEWKLQQGNLLIETDAVDPEKAMYVCYENSLYDKHLYYK